LTREGRGISAAGLGKSDIKQRKSEAELEKSDKN